LEQIDARGRLNGMGYRQIAVLGLVALLAGCDASTTATPKSAVHRVIPTLDRNGALWFLGGSEPGSVFGRSGPLYRLAPHHRPVPVALPKRVWNVTAFAVSPDGGTIALAQGGGEFPPRNISTIRPDGTGLRNLTSGNFYDVAPSWSPDGKLIVFSSSRCCATWSSTGNYALYIMARDGGDLHRVFTDSSSDVNPSWSPDGSRIAFVRLPVNGGGWTIWSVSATGADPRQLTRDTRLNDAVAWSPDGTQLAYVSHLIDDKDWQIRLMRPDGSGMHMIFRCATPCHGGGYWLTWSPDGKQIAFVEYIKQPDNTYLPRLAVVGADGHHYHLLDTSGISACCPSWTALRQP
jgi:Tol biopolymer transport system component